MRKVKLTKESTKDILETLLKRSPNNYGKYEDAVADILAKVKAEGDEALFAFTREFDKVEVTKETIRVTPEEIEEAYKLVDPSLIDVIKKALVNIRSYHEKQLQNSWFTSTTDGTMLGQKVTALNRVGVYVPGGKAVYPSSVLMNIVPAKVAGVDRIVMTTPPPLQKKQFMVMSALTPLPDQARSLFLQMRLQIHVISRQIFFLRQSMMRWRPRS